MKTADNAKEFELELTRIYNSFNQHYWNNELPEVIITFVGTKGAYGHLSSEPAWISADNDNKYELNISAYTLDRSPEDICRTLLHEQCHLYNKCHNIKDTSNMGRYHNKRFKQTAETHGLICLENDRLYGHSYTVLTDEAKQFIKKLKVKKFKYKRAVVTRGGNLNRYSCPNCHKPIVYVSSPQNILCGFCNTRLVHTPYRKGSSP